MTQDPRVVVGDTGPCTLCGTQGLLTVSLPHGWTNSLGRQVQGYYPFLLCPSCHADDPNAGPLITFFHVHGHITGDNVDQFIQLLATWVKHLSPPTVDPDDFEADLAAWRAGEFDDNDEPI